MYNPQIETLPLEKLRELQNQRLAVMLKRIYDKVPFYKNKFDSIGLKPEDIKGVEDLHLLPFTKKTDLRDHYPFGLFTCGEDQLNRIHCSSGTTGKPTVVGYTKNDLDVFDEVVARSLACAGAKPGMKLHNAYGYGLFTGGLGMHGGATKLGMAVVPISGGMTDRQLRLLEDFQSEVICCTPSYAQTIANECIKRGIDVSSRFNLKYAILGAEPWTEAIRQEIEQKLNLKATNIYGLSEIIGPGVSQEDFEEQGTGSYIWEDHFYPEIVDKDTGKPLPYGEEGVLVFTTLTKEAFPVLRYWTNDICSLTYDHSHKRTHIKMGTIKGRSDDMLIIRGVNLFHTQVESIIENIPQLSPYYQLIVTKENAMDRVEVKVETSDSNDINNLDLSKGFVKKIKDNIGISMKVTLVEPGGVPRSEGGKLKRILDLRSK